jgi:hypothetical protein
MSITLEAIALDPLGEERHRLKPYTLTKIIRPTDEVLLDLMKPVCAGACRTVAFEVCPRCGARQSDECRDLAANNAQVAARPPGPEDDADLAALF